MAKELGMTKDRIVIRQREMQDGGASLFLDIHHNGKRTRELLKLYLVPGNSRAAKELNKQTMAQAETIRSQRQIEMQSGEYEVLHEFKTDTLFLQYYREMCTARLRTDSQGNWGNWRSCLRYLESYCDESTTFKDITPRWIEGFKEYLENVEIDAHRRCSRRGDDDFRGLSQNSKVSYFNKLKACINQALHDRIIPNSPLYNIKGFKPEEVEMEYLEWEEVKKLDATDCENEFLKNAFLFSCFTGLRKSDVLKLTWGEIQKLGDFTRIIFKQKKTGGQEYLDIPEQAVKYLGTRGDMNDRVFGGFHYSQKTSLELRKWAKKAGIEKEFTYHASRHTFAVLLLYFGADIYTVSKMLGHREIATTQIYAKVLDKQKQEASRLFPSFND